METVNVRGGSGDPTRGTWCTPLPLARMLGRFDADPCSNPRSHIEADIKLMLESGDDGLAGAPGQFRHHEHGVVTLTDSDRVFVNCPYGPGVVSRWVAHYVVTDFTFLLRWDPSTPWFEELIVHTNYIWFPSRNLPSRERRVNFEPPPGVEASSQAFPHALYMKSMPNASLIANGSIFEPRSISGSYR